MAEQIIKGRIYVVGDHVDTDQIIPAEFLNLVPTIRAEYEKLGTHAFGGLPEDYPPFVKDGMTSSEYSIVVAGRNFGCGSSREHAPIALGAAGIRAIVAESYARIFFRNTMATGEFYPCEFEQGALGGRQRESLFHTGDEAEVRLGEASVQIRCRGVSLAIKPLGAAAEVIASGGLFGYARKTGMIKASVHE